MDKKRMTRSAIAAHGKLDRDTLRKYLVLPGAPQPDGKMLYDFKAVMEWIKANAPRAGSGNDEMRKIRESILRMEAEDMEIDLKVKRGLYVEKSKIMPTIRGFMSVLTEDMKLKLEQELPAKYVGRTAIENLKLNSEAMDWILLRLKNGTAPFAGNPS